jgi:hypothetical protein
VSLGLRLFRVRLCRNYHFWRFELCRHGIRPSNLDWVIFLEELLFSHYLFDLFGR